MLIELILNQSCGIKINNRNIREATKYIREGTMSVKTTLGGLFAGAAMIAITTATAHGQTLTQVASQGWITEAELALGAKFEAETGIKVDYQLLPDDQYYNVLIARLNVGEGPDIFGGQSGYSDLLSYNVVENAVDLSDQPWASRLDRLVGEAASIDDALYGMTYWNTTGDPWIMNYNVAMFEEYDLEVPKTFAELKEACSVLSAAGITPIYQPFADGWHHVLLFAELGPNYAARTDDLVETLNANQATLAGNESMTQTLNDFNELYQSGCFGDDALSDQFAAAPSKIVDNEAAMVYSTASFYSQVANEFPDYDTSNIGVFIAPLGDNQMIGVNPAGPTKFVYAGGDNVDLALQYLEFLARPDNMAAMIAHPDGPRDLPFSDAQGGLPAHIQAVLDENAENQGIVLQTAVNYVNPQWMDIGQDLTAMVTGMIDAERVLSNIDKRRADMASAAGDAAWE